MRVLIRFRPDLKSAPFLASRLRKNIKGALELVGIEHTESFEASPDLCHFLSPSELPYAEMAEEEGIPYVVSALYAEEDPDGSFLEEGKKGPLLSRKAERLLKGASRIFVPTEEARATLFENGIDLEKIRVITPGVNLSRFSRGESDNGVFARYFRFSQETPYFLSFASWKEKEALRSLVALASALPTCRFYAISFTDKKAPGRIWRIRQKIPKNLFFVTRLEESLYRSALFGARGLLGVGERAWNPLTSYEAFASLVPIVVIGKAKRGDMLSARNARFFESEQKAAESLLSLSPQERSSTIIGEYETAKENSVAQLGKDLKKEYEELLSSKKE